MAVTTIEPTLDITLNSVYSLVTELGYPFGKNVVMNLDFASKIIELRLNFPGSLASDRTSPETLSISITLGLESLLV
eukprot:CAMPEP_0170488218 /NCGR_PEP_ID=MMETSP0208-20121228/6828_1 /TAXON_ID=197538 /ORGANISM="Strombidium inclinatum, Strain S3" /LENGTH=76 /DNA_ID=CAMNT_0010762727 /DNA_START=1239 /DNA_END=1469 /DNA_ORIENTATION=+